LARASSVASAEAKVFSSDLTTLVWNVLAAWRASRFLSLAIRLFIWAA